MDNTIKKKQNQKAVKHIMHINAGNITTLFYWAQSCAVKIHYEMRTILKSMPITLNAPHSITKCTHTGNPNKAALSFQTLMFT